jgi:hypothetical protein
MAALSIHQEFNGWGDNAFLPLRIQDGPISKELLYIYTDGRDGRLSAMYVLNCSCFRKALHSRNFFALNQLLMEAKDYYFGLA